MKSKWAVLKIRCLIILVLVCFVGCVSASKKVKVYFEDDGREQSIGIGFSIPIDSNDNGVQDKRRKK